MKNLIITTDLKNFKSKLEKFSDTSGLAEKVAMRLGNEYLGKVKEVTPVGDYSDRLQPYNAKPAGALRDSWKVYYPVKTDKGVSITVKNSLYYATYVNDGHFQKFVKIKGKEIGQFIPPFGKRAKRRFVKGQHFVERANREFQDQMDVIIGHELDRQLKKALEK